MIKRICRPIGWHIFLISVYFFIIMHNNGKMNVDFKCTKR